PMKKAKIAFICSALISGMVVSATVARASKATSRAAIAACFTSTGAGSTCLIQDGHGGITTNSTNACATTCAFDSIFSVRDLATTSYFEVDLHSSGSTTAQACTHDFSSSSFVCGNTSSSGNNFTGGMSVADLSKWTTTGWIPYLSMTVAGSSSVWGFWFVTD